MNSIALDNNNNIIATKSWQIVSGNDSLRQDIKNRLAMFNKEYPFDINQGIDYITLLSLNRKDDLQNAITKEILKDSRVKSVKVKDLSFNKNRLAFEIEVTTNENEVIYV